MSLDAQSEAAMHRSYVKQEIGKQSWRFGKVGADGDFDSAAVSFPDVVEDRHGSVEAR